MGVPLSYISHVTGHGLLKLMRPARELTYRIHTLPEVQEVLAFLVVTLEPLGLTLEGAELSLNPEAGP